MNNWKEEALKFIIDKTDRNSESIKDNFPHASKNKKYNLENPQWWTAGFWPGVLWKVYSSTENNKLKNLANSCETKMDTLLMDSEKLDHDMGFMWTLSSIANYKLTGNEESRRRALCAANFLAGRFNILGNYIRAWNHWIGREDNSGVAIIDCVMNLPLLYWASEESNDPRFKHIAMKHADMVLEHFIREDGSVQHMVVFDSETGEVKEKLGGQGFAANSGWARGCAWAIYGLSLSYMYTKEERYLNAAKKSAHYFISNLPEDKCPVWDFRVPEDNEIKYSYRDSSAASIAACGLLLIGELVHETESKLYLKEGENILKSLYENYSSKNDLEEEGLITCATGHFPEQTNLEVPIIYGDYYFVEGILKLTGDKTIFW